jgi:predicted outer membrane repeat protein
MQLLLSALVLLAAHAAAQKCVPGSSAVVEISTAKDAEALANAIICPGVTVRAVFTGTVQPTDTITVGPKSKLVVVASGGSKAAVIDGQGTVQLFNVSAGGELSLQNVVLSNGYAVAEGGGILAAAGSAITIINSKLEGNVARRGAAIYTDGSVSIQQVHPSAHCYSNDQHVCSCHLSASLYIVPTVLCYFYNVFCIASPTEHCL